MLSVKPSTAIKTNDNFLIMFGFDVCTNLIIIFNNSFLCNYYTKKNRRTLSALLYISYVNSYFAYCLLRLGRYSLETDTFLRPFALLLDNTLRPFLLDMRFLKPCLLFRFLTEG